MPRRFKPPWTARGLICFGEWTRYTPPSKSLPLRASRCRVPLPSVSHDEVETDQLAPAHLDGLSVGASMLLSCELDSGGAGNRQAPPDGHAAARGPAHIQLEAKAETAVLHDGPYFLAGAEREAAMSDVPLDRGEQVRGRFSEIDDYPTSRPSCEDFAAKAVRGRPGAGER